MEPGPTFRAAGPPGGQAEEQGHGDKEPGRLAWCRGINTTELTEEGLNVLTFRVKHSLDVFGWSCRIKHGCKGALPVLEGWRIIRI